MPIRFQFPGVILCKAALLVLAAAWLAGCAASKAGTKDDANPFAGMPTDEILMRGDEVLAAEEYDRALFIYMQALEIEETADIWHRIGVTKLRLDDKPFAWKAFNTALELDPNHAPSYEELGLIYVGMGQPDTAKPLLLRAVNMDTNRWRAFNALGVMADMEKNYVQAVKYYKAALEGNPGSAALMNNIGYSNYLAGDLQGATTWFDQAIQADTDYKPAIINLGLLYARQGWYDEAVKTFKRAVPAPQAHNDAGYIALRNGDLDEASTLLTEAIRLSPTYYKKAYENLEQVRDEMQREDRRSQQEHLADNLSEVVFPEDHENKTRTVMPQALNIRAAPSPDAKITSYLKTGDEVRIIVTRQDWSFVSFRPRGSTSAEVTGWVRNRYLLSGEEARAATVEAQMEGSSIAQPADSATAANDEPAENDTVSLPPVTEKKPANLPPVPIDMSALVDE